MCSSRSNLLFKRHFNLRPTIILCWNCMNSVQTNCVGGDMSGVLTQKIVVFICFHQFSAALCPKSIVFTVRVSKSVWFEQFLHWWIELMWSCKCQRLSEKNWKTRSDKALSGTPWPSTFNWPEIHPCSMPEHSIIFKTQAAQGTLTHPPTLDPIFTRSNFRDDVP